MFWAKKESRRRVENIIVCSVPRLDWEEQAGQVGKEEENGGGGAGGGGGRRRVEEEGCGWKEIIGAGDFRILAFVVDENHKLSARFPEILGPSRGSPRLPRLLPRLQNRRVLGGLTTETRRIYGDFAAYPTCTGAEAPLPQNFAPKADSMSLLEFHRTRHFTISRPTSAGPPRPWCLQRNCACTHSGLVFVFAFLTPRSLTADCLDKNSCQKLKDAISSYNFENVKEIHRSDKMASHSLARFAYTNPSNQIILHTQHFFFF